MASRGGSFGEIFEKPLPENPTLIESLSTPWKQIKPKKPAELSSFTELFGELHFKEPSYDSSSSSSLSPRPSSLSSWSPSSSIDVNLQPAEIEKLNDKNNENKMNPSSDALLGIQKNQYMKSSKSTATGFSSKKAGSLQLCTEGLGFESSDDVENSKDESGDDWKNNQKGKMSITRNSSASDNLNEYRRLRTTVGNFPPPISCLGKNGKPWVCLKSFRYNGRFVLKEIEIPTKEFLHACREDGRLTLRLVQQDEEIPEEGEEEEAELDEEEAEYDDEEEAEYDDAYEQEDEEEEKKSEFSNVGVEGNM